MARPAGAELGSPVMSCHFISQPSSTGRMTDSIASRVHSQETEYQKPKSYSSRKGGNAFLASPSFSRPSPFAALVGPVIQYVCYCRTRASCITRITLRFFFFSFSAGTTWCEMRTLSVPLNFCQYYKTAYATSPHPASQ